MKPKVSCVSMGSGRRGVATKLYFQSVFWSEGDVVQTDAMHYRYNFIIAHGGFISFISAGLRSWPL